MVFNTVLFFYLINGMMASTGSDTDSDSDSDSEFCKWLELFEKMHSKAVPNIVEWISFSEEDKYLLPASGTRTYFQWRRARQEDFDNHINAKQQ